MKKQKNKIFYLTKNEINDIKNEQKHYKKNKAVCIEALKIVQKYRGWVSDNVIYEIAEILKVSFSEIEEIATFYNQIFRKPVGKNIIRYCDSFVCYINGYKNIKKKIENILNIKTGQTTQDKKFTLLPTCCLGNCDKSPTIMINEDTYILLTPEIIPDLLGKYNK